MRGATSVTLQPHQIPRLPHRMTRMLDRRHIWNVIYNARSNRCHHPTSPNTAPATQNDSHAWSSSHMKRHLQCAEQQVSPSNLTKYRACHTEWLACLIVVTYETSFTMRGATGVTIQPHQILRLPRKMTRLLYRPHIWNFIYIARSNQCLPPNSPNTAPATQNDHLTCGRNLRKTGETSFPMRGRSENDPSMIRAWKRKPQPASQVRLLFELPRSIFYCKIQRFDPNLTFKHSPSAVPATKSNTWPSPNTAPTTKVTLDLHRILPLPRKVTLELHQILPLPRKVTLDLHQVLHLPRKVTRIVHPRDIWTLIYNARSNQCLLPNSPNTAPCHAKWPLNVWQKFAENRWNVISNAGTIREWSEHENANRNPPRKWGYFWSSPGAFSIVKYNVSSPILHSNIHQVLRLPQKVTLDLHRILPLPRKVTLDLHRILPLPQK